MISIFTPTFNRKQCVKRLAESLLRQTNSDFEWIIIDDGSSDNTYEILDNYKDKIDIKYEYQQNSGKYIAYNRAIQLAKGKLFVCVDSDDLLTDNAIDLYDSIYQSNDKSIGYLLPQKLLGVNDIEKWHKISGKYINVIDLKFIYAITESNILIKTEFLKNYNFPLFYDKSDQPEKFCPEDLLYNDLSNSGKFKVIDKAVYMSEYLNDGLTSHVFKLWIENSSAVLSTLQSRYRLFEEYSFSRKIISKSKCIMNINALCMAKKIRIRTMTPSKVMSLILFLPSAVFRRKRFKKYERTS